MTVKLFKGEFNISFSFALMVALLLCCDKTGMMTVSLVSIFVHEMGHLVMLYVLKLPPRRVNFRLCGIEIVESRLYCGYSAQIAVAASGPLINILLGLIFLPFSYLPIAAIVSASNIVIGVFNLLPLSQLDGGEILCCAMSAFMSEQKGKKISRIIDMLFILLLITGGVYIFLMPNHNPTLLITAVYLLVYAIIKHR